MTAAAGQPTGDLVALLRSGQPAAGADHACLIGSDCDWSYDEFWRHVDAVAAAVQAFGVGRGDRVATHVHKSPLALATYLGVVRAGAVYLPLNPAYRRDEVAYFFGDAQPSLLIADPDDQPWIEAIAGRVPLVWCDRLGDGSWAAAVADELSADDPSSERTTAAADDLAAIVYTSGTTGRAKGAMLTHGNLIANLLTLNQLWGMSRGDVLVHALPIFHVHGLFVATNLALLNGIPMRFHRSFVASEVLADLSRSTVLMGVPTMYTRLLAEPALDVSAVEGMRLFISGSAPLTADTHRAFHTRTGHHILERYGMTETGMLTSNPLTGPRRPGFVGQPLPDVELRLVDGSGVSVAPGEAGDIEVRGPNVFGGYWRRPELRDSEFTADGFFRTGDVGRIDADGSVELLSRSKDVVITGGFNVYPKEVEAAVDALAGVAESAVVGIPDADFGEAVTAAVVESSPGAFDADAGRAVLRAQMAVFKVPKRFVVVGELPRNAMGKVDKVALRVALAAAVEDQANVKPAN